MSDMVLYEKKYKEAMDRMELCVRSGLKITPEYIFPELAESEDERMRKRLILNFSLLEKEEWGELKVKDICTWLEKQGKQKASYTTIAETGDGGINALVTRELPTDGEQKPADSYCQENCKGFQETGKCFADGECKAKREAEQKSAWSEEDERMFNSCCAAVAAADYYTLDDKQDIENWLKSLRPQNRWKPSDEQIKVCKEVYADILSAKGFDLGTVVSELNRLEEGLKKKGE